MIRSMTTLTVVAGLMSGQAQADTVKLSDAAGTQAECSACHQEYPARFLPPASWTQILATLDQHFGEDAALPADTVAQIAAYLTTNASTQFSNIDPANLPLRITGLQWYKRVHERFTDRALADPNIGTMSNCAGCHTGM